MHFRWLPRQFSPDSAVLSSPSESFIAVQDLLKVRLRMKLFTKTVADRSAFEFQSLFGPKSAMAKAGLFSEEPEQLSKVHP